MTETLARIDQEGKVEFVDEKLVRIAAPSMSADEAAFLARGLLACAAALAFNPPPEAGPIGGDAHFPILKWVLTTVRATGKPVIIFSIPPGIELTFQMTPQLEKELGAALVAHEEGRPPPEAQTGTVH
jgi:hypothetical protein